MAVEAADREFTPKPVKTQASSGSAAASPHTPTAVLNFLPSLQVWSMSRSTAGCHGSVR